LSSESFLDANNYWIGKTYVNGIAMEYDLEAYDPKILAKNLLKKDFIRIVNQINDTLFNFFPCPMCQCFGYCCCPCTLGLSFCLPLVCVRDAEGHARDYIGRINKDFLGQKKVEMHLIKAFGTSWVSDDVM
jgi:hypothetical protein